MPCKLIIKNRFPSHLAIGHYPKADGHSHQVYMTKPKWLHSSNNTTFNKQSNFTCTLKLKSQK